MSETLQETVARLAADRDRNLEVLEYEECEYEVPDPEPGGTWVQDRVNGPDWTWVPDEPEEEEEEPPPIPRDRESMLAWFAFEDREFDKHIDRLAEKYKGKFYWDDVKDKGPEAIKEWEETVHD